MLTEGTAQLFPKATAALDLGGTGHVRGGGMPSPRGKPCHQTSQHVFLTRLGHCESRGISGPSRKRG
jgi:hypothetical protein